MNLNYIIVYAQDFQKLKSFYMNQLGMTNLGSVSSEAFATLQPANGGAVIGLQDNRTSQLPPSREQHPGSVELSFAVEDVDAVFRDWQANGVEIIAAPHDLPFGRYMLAKDPEGHYLSAYKFVSRS